MGKRALRYNPEGSSPDGMDYFSLLNPSSRNMTLG
jgi:hypothetical protein